MTFYKLVRTSSYSNIVYETLSCLLNRKHIQYPPRVSISSLKECESNKNVVSSVERVLYAALYNKETNETIDITYFFKEVAIDPCVILTAGELTNIVSSSWYFHMMSFVSRKFSGVLRNCTSHVIVLISSNLIETVYEMHQRVLPWES